MDLELQAGDTLRIRAGRFETHVKGIDADEFPAIPVAGERPTTRIPQRVLRQALNETTFAAASDEARPILTGVLCRFEGDQLTLAAADNYRIAVKTIPILDPVEETSIVVPARSLNELSGSSPTSTTRSTWCSPRARTRSSSTSRGSTSSAGSSTASSPTTSRSCPKGHTTRTVIDREELLKAVRLAALIASSAANIVKLGVGVEGEPAVVVSAAAEVGDNEGRVEAVVEGDGTTIAFNARYLADVLQNVTADQFALELNGPLSPGVFRPVGDDAYTHVVMPVRTTS